MFIKKKTAKEIQQSLVGTAMCKRDSYGGEFTEPGLQRGAELVADGQELRCCNTEIPIAAVQQVSAFPPAQRAILTPFPCFCVGIRIAFILFR